MASPPHPVVAAALEQEPAEGKSLSKSSVTFVHIGRMKVHAMQLLHFIRRR